MRTKTATVIDRCDRRPTKGQIVFVQSVTHFRGARTRRTDFVISDVPFGQPRAGEPARAGWLHADLGSHQSGDVATGSRALGVARHMRAADDDADTMEPRGVVAFIPPHSDDEAEALASIGYEYGHGGQRGVDGTGNAVELWASTAARATA